MESGYQNKTVDNKIYNDKKIIKMPSLNEIINVIENKFTPMLS